MFPKSSLIAVLFAALALAGCTIVPAGVPVGDAALYDRRERERTVVYQQPAQQAPNITIQQPQQQPHYVAPAPVYEAPTYRGY